jgi:hypothetical protein
MQHGEGEIDQGHRIAPLSMTMERGCPASAGRGEVRFCAVKVERYVEAGAADSPGAGTNNSATDER